jgi:hypothetical protein
MDCLQMLLPSASTRVATANCARNICGHTTITIHAFMGCICDVTAWKVTNGRATCSQLAISWATERLRAAPWAVLQGHQNRYTAFYLVLQALQCMRSRCSRRHNDLASKSLALLLCEYLNSIRKNHENGLALSAASAGQAWVRQHGLPADPATISQHAIWHRKLRAEHLLTHNVHLRCVYGLVLGRSGAKRDKWTCNMQPAGQLMCCGKNIGLPRKATKADT